MFELKEVIYSVLNNQKDPITYLDIKRVLVKAGHLNLERYYYHKLKLALNHMVYDGEVECEKFGTISLYKIKR